MPRISSIAWIFGLYLAVTLAPQLRIWTWGPAMVFFSISAACSVSTIWTERRSRVDSLLIALGALVVSWIAIRAAMSPVYELAQSDLLLTTMAVSTFFVFRSAARSESATKILVYGIAVLLLASVCVIGLQFQDPTYSLLFPNSKERYPAGFFAHYSYGATFLIFASLFVGAFSLFGKGKAYLKIFLALISVSGMVAVYFTNSRGGMLGMGGGAAVLILLSLLSGEHRRKRWFAPAVILVPLLMVGAAVFYFKSLGGVIEERGGTAENMSGMLDNSIRLFLFNIAVSCVALHPAFGGGSRSFSWECFRFWDTEAMGAAVAKPEHVHNELLQTATDYGLVGAGLLIVLLTTLATVAFTRIFLGKSKPVGVFDNALRIGGLSALAGIFIQSNFEGILRIPPGAIALAVCISTCCLPVVSESARRGILFWFSRSYLTVLVTGAGILMLVSGIKGSMVSRKVWPVYFSRIPINTEESIDRLSGALATWPLQSLFTQRGTNYGTLAGSLEGTERSTVNELAAEDFRKAAGLHPFDPEIYLRLANTLDALGRREEARIAFDRAVTLQGGMESLFKARRYYADHLNEEGVRVFREGDLMEALSLFGNADLQMDRIASEYGDYFGETNFLVLRARIIANKGQVLGDLEDFRGAEAEFQEAAKLPGGNFANYLLGMLYGKLAVSAWTERRGEDALRFFLDARQQVALTQELPSGVSPGKRDEWVAYLDQSIGYLQAAKFKPSEKVDF